jgi:hypothetical protein
MERTIIEPATVTGCRDCEAGLAHCHEASIEHVDGFTECLDPMCSLHHGLHEWQLPCSVFDPPCACSPDEGDLDIDGMGVAFAVDGGRGQRSSLAVAA